MSDQGGHAPVSNEPETTGQFGVTEQVSESSFRGEHDERVQKGHEVAEATLGYRRPETGLAQLFTIPEGPTLRAIGEASFGEPASESVLLKDDRVRITNTTVYPWKTHASLLITAADNSQWVGTAWFIGPHTLATAGHCVFIYKPGLPYHGWVQSIEVMPGRDGANLPFGRVISTKFRAVEEWTKNGNRNYDYGAIIIPTALGNTTGGLGFSVYPDHELLGTDAHICGYPSDKEIGTIWYHSRQVSSVDPFKVYYDIDTMAGQSGSAVYTALNGERLAIAIHAYGAGGGPTNSGTRITRPVYDNLVAWKA